MLIAVALCVGIILGWQYFAGPPVAPPAAPEAPAALASAPGTAEPAAAEPSAPMAEQGPLFDFSRPSDVSFLILAAFFVLYLILDLLGVVGGPIAKDMPYANGWRRAGAVAVESLVFSVVIIPVAVAPQLRGIAFQFILLLAGIISAVYPVITHRYWGQNLGKLVLGIKVCRKDGADIGWREAVIRSSVDITFYMITSVTYLVTYLQVADQLRDASAAQEGNILLQSLPWFYHWLSDLLWVWWCSEALVALYNRRRRAIHDYMAGTVVLVKNEL